jgi:protein TonB
LCLAAGGRRITARMSAMRSHILPSDGRRCRIALGFSFILHALALACMVLLHVQATQRVDQPPLEVVMVTLPPLPQSVPRPEPVRPPVAPAVPPPRAAPVIAPAPAPSALESPPVANVQAPPPAAAPAPQALAPALDATPRPAAPSGAAPVVPASAPAVPAARPTPLVPPSFDADYLHNPTPRYPPAAARLRESGRVLLSVAVSAAGLPERVEVAATSGSPRLDQAAIETVKRWRFVPARQGDKPVAASVTVPLVFRLDE